MMFFCIFYHLLFAVSAAGPVASNSHGSHCHQEDYHHVIVQHRLVGCVHGDQPPFSKGLLNLEILGVTNVLKNNYWWNDFSPCLCPTYQHSSAVQQECQSLHTESYSLLVESVNATFFYFCFNRDKPTWVYFRNAVCFHLTSLSLLTMSSPLAPLIWARRTLS